MTCPGRQQHCPVPALRPIEDPDSAVFAKRAYSTIEKQGSVKDSRPSTGRAVSGAEADDGASKRKFQDAISLGGFHAV